MGVSSYPAFLVLLERMLCARQCAALSWNESGNSGSGGRVGGRPGVERQSRGRSLRRGFAYYESAPGR
jgi:hypothetical protein